MSREALRASGAVAGQALAPRHTSVQGVCESLRTALAPYLRGDRREPWPSPSRDAALGTYRRILQDQIRHDLVYNLKRLSLCAVEVGDQRKVKGGFWSLVADLFARLDEGLSLLQSTDPYSAGSTEERCWLALHQFYCDALELADRLMDVEHGRPRRVPRRRADGTYRRRELFGLSAYGRWDCWCRAAEVAVPNPFEMRVRRTILPTIAFMLRHQVVPWGRPRWWDMERTMRGWVGRDGIARLRGERREVVRLHGREALLGSAALFEPGGKRTRSNVVIAASHRLGFLDFPLWAAILEGIPHALWTNDAFYIPGIARKLARDGTLIPVRGPGKLALDAAVEQTHRVLAERSMPVIVVADGSQPNMMYGQQVRVKRGLRVLVDECVRRGRTGGRRTFVVPLTFDDPLGYVCGVDDEIHVTLHPPIEVVKPSSEEPGRSEFDESAVNGGDDLLNHLEGLFLLNSMQPRYGLSTPDVVEAVRLERAKSRRPGWRGLLQARALTSVAALSRAVYSRRAVSSPSRL